MFVFVVAILNMLTVTNVMCDDSYIVIDGGKIDLANNMTLIQCTCICTGYYVVYRDVVDNTIWLSMQFRGKNYDTIMWLIGKA